MTEEKHYLYVGLTNYKYDNHAGAWDNIRNAVSPWYQGGLTDDFLQDQLKKGGFVEIEFKPTGQREKAIEKLSKSSISFELKVKNK